MQNQLNLNKKIKIKDQNNRWNDVEYKLKEDDKYIYYSADLVREPKISSHTLINLANLNKWTSPGKTVLSMFGLLKRESINPYYTYRGGIAEVFAKRYLLRKYGMQANIESFELSMFKDFNQFPDAEPFSGVLDLMMYSPQKMTIEVKSKEMKDYDYIAGYGQYPRDQVAQGANQAILAETEEYMMLWIFPKDEIAKMLKQIAEEDLWIWEDDYEQASLDLGLTEDMFEYHAKIFKADIRIINAYREKALSIYNDFYIHRRIEKKLFTKEELKELKESIK